MARKISLMIFLLIFPAILAGCPVSAPAIRIAHGGAPGKLAARESEVGAGLAFSPAADELPGLSGRYKHSITDSMAIEGGIDSHLGTSVIFNGGMKYTPWPLKLQKRKMKFLIDLELGVGLGMGGSLDDPDDYCYSMYSCDTGDPDWEDDERYEDGRSWSERFAGGGYGGFGLGYNIAFFDMYIRARYQLSSATNIPFTQIGSVMQAFQFNIKRVGIYFGAGFFFYKNDLTGRGWLFGEAGLAFSF